MSRSERLKRKSKIRAKKRIKHHNKEKREWERSQSKKKTEEQ